jgi:hypothetical protein
MLEPLCGALGFDPETLSWPAGQRLTDGVWGRYWYDGGATPVIRAAVTGPSAAVRVARNAAMAATVIRAARRMGLPCRIRAGTRATARYGPSRGTAAGMAVGVTTRPVSGGAVAARSA